MPAKPDAIALLKEDHRKVEDLFEKFEKSRDDQRKQALAKEICTELMIHSMIEEEIFYPACKDQIEDEDQLEEAYVEHDGAKVLIAEHARQRAGRRVLRRQGHGAVGADQAPRQGRGEALGRPVRPGEGSRSRHPGARGAYYGAEEAAQAAVRRWPVAATAYTQLQRS